MATLTKFEMATLTKEAAEALQGQLHEILLDAGEEDAPARRVRLNLPPPISQHTEADALRRTTRLAFERVFNSGRPAAEPRKTGLTAEQCIDNGVDWLDLTFGRDWVFRVRPSSIEISSPFRCILGQVAGDGGSYFRVTREHGLGFSDCKKMGFTGTLPGKHRTTEEVNEMWKERVRALRRERGTHGGEQPPAERSGPFAGIRRVLASVCL